MNTKKNQHVTVTEDEGVNYRDIADTMSEMGFTMNHSSVHNYVVKIMQKFAEEIAEEWDIDATPEMIKNAAKSPLFQNNIAEMLHIIEAQRISTQKNRREVAT